jgi:hypothetical protein
MGKMFSADKNAGAGTFAMSRAEMEKSIAEIEKLQIPDIEKQQIKLQMMSDAGYLNAEQMEQEGEISTDPALRDAQMQALSALRERGQAGLTEEDMAAQNLMLRGVAAQEQAQQKGLLQGMAERGALDSGAQLAAQLSGQQGSYNRAYEQSQQNAIAAAQAKREALAQAGNMAQGMEQADFSRGQNERGYRQAIDQFNLQNRMAAQQANLGIRQGDVGLKNQEQMYNKELFQRDFENRRSKTQLLSNARTGNATNLQNQARAEAEAEQARAAGNRQMLMSGVQAGAGMYNANQGKQAAYYNSLENGGLAYADGGNVPHYMSDGSGEIVPGDSLAGDRIDAKLNAGEAVLNVPQQQRLMDVIRGEEDLTALGDEDIIEGVPESYRNKLHGKEDKKQTMGKGFQRLLEMLGK